MKKNKINIIIAGIVLVTVASCTKKLDLFPANDVTPANVYSTSTGYKQALAKVYGAFALTGNGTNGNGTGSQDIPAQIIQDEGNSDFLRLYWNLQELTTDEAAWTWQNDAGIKGLHELNWSSINPIINGLYYRSFFQIALANDFIRQSSDKLLSDRGIPAASADSIRKYRAEARFLRAYQYWVLMDVYANPPFVTEADAVGTGLPKQIQRKDLFTYIETELKAIEPEMIAARANEYGRADKAAVWSLLSRLYLNAQVYTGTPRFNDAITYCSKVIGAGYTLHSNYRELMLADNNLNTDEFIFTINYDAQYTRNYGGTTYLTHGPAAVPGSLSGTSGNWGGLRVTQNLVDFYADPSGTTDKRPQFYTVGQNKIMTDLYTGTDGYSITKFKNKTRSGGPAPHADPQGEWVDIDFPVFRLAEIYLTYAECVLRGGTGGDAATALGYINQLRARAYGNTTGNITAGQLTTDFILDERARELYFEMQRRTDLIRYGKFTTSNYLWAWKGGVAAGRAVDNKYNIFPLPTTDLSSNPNLVQTPVINIKLYKKDIMRSILNKLIIISIACSFFAACKKDGDLTYLKVGALPAVTLSPATIVLSSATASDSSETITWTRSNYGFSAAVSYTLQIAKAGTNFAGAQQISMGNNVQMKFTGNYLNTLAISAGIAAGSQGQLDVRIKSTLSDSLSTYSDKTTLTVTTYQTAYPALMLQGGNGWVTPAGRTNGFVLTSPNYDGKYEGFIYLPNADGYGGDAFKLVSTTTATVYGWGSDPKSAGGGAFQVDMKVGSGNLWFTPAPNYIKVNADINTLKATYTPVKFYISGDDNSWSTSATPMTYNATTKVLTATNVTLTAGKTFVFTTNGGYDISYKVDNNKKLVFAGPPNWAGNNIPITTTGTYTVTLDLSGGDGSYTYKIQ